MNQARTGTMLYPPIRTARPSRASWLWRCFAFFGVFVLTHTFVFVLGHAYGYSLGSLKPATVITRNVTPLVQWNCTAPERREYFEACKRRAQSTLTGPKE